MMRRYALTIAVAVLLLAIPRGLPATEPLDHGVALFEAGDFDAARQVFQGIVEENGDNHVALFYLGRIALANNELDVAIDYLKTAVKLNANDSVYRTTLGRAYLSKLQTVTFMQRGMLAGRALDNLKKAVELDPANVQARISLGGYYLNAPSIAGGSKKKALEQANEVVKYDALQGNWMLARIHIKKEEYDQAIEKLNACISARPDNIQYRYQLGMLYQELERYNDAFGAFEQVLEITPGDPGALYQIGRTAAFSGVNVDRGIECLRAYMAAETKPGYPGNDGAHWRLGMLFEHKGDRSKARSEYETAVRLNPGEDKYRESLENLDAQ